MQLQEKVNIIFNSVENIFKKLLPDKEWIVNKNNNKIEIYEKYKQIDSFSIEDFKTSLKIVVPIIDLPDDSYVCYFKSNREINDILQYMHKSIYYFYK
mgnify:CR=1 FL=1|tara:strand:+ start:111 stop:404 length:294 start_codon:yes stop_codon:yes gene_type:complete